MDKIIKGHPAYRSLRGAYLQACGRKSSDIVGLIKTMEELFLGHLCLGEAKEGDSFSFELGTGFTLRVEFYKGNCAVYASYYFSENTRERLILSREMSAAKNYDALIGFQKNLEIPNLAIGKYPKKEFVNLLLSLKPGQIISFEEGKSYVCKKIDKGIPVLAKVFDGDIKNINIKKFMEGNEFRLEVGDPLFIQKFYHDNCKVLTQNAEADISLIDDALLFVKRIEGEVHTFKSKQVKIGPVSLIAKKQHGEVQWFDNKGSSVTRDQVAYLVGVLNTNPSVTAFDRKVPNYQKTAEDEEFCAKIEGLLDSTDYKAAFQEMLRYSNENKEDLSIQTDSFLRDDSGNYVCGTVLFQNGTVNQVIYKDNNFEEVNKILPLSEADFVALCQYKYTELHTFIFAYTMQEIEEMYAKREAVFLQNQRNIAHRLADEKMKKTKGLIATKDKIAIRQEEYEEVIENITNDNSIDLLLDRDEKE